MDTFKKRTYSGLGEFLGDLGYLVKNRKRIQEVFQAKSLPANFRERMMLAVTRVNECRYCARFHTSAAMKEGVSREEIGHLLSGEFGDCPPDQVEGILYAQTWAECRESVDVETRKRLVAAYGNEMAEEIDVALRVIRMGNLAGNSVDALLHGISRGRWGK